MVQTAEQQRITQLIQLDDKSDNIIQGYYQRALEQIRNNLNQFYIEYATATGLSVNEVEQRVSKWDVQQFKQAINTLDNELSDSDKETKQYVKTREKVAKVQGSLNNRRYMLLGLIGLATLTASVRANKYAKQRISNDLTDEYSFLNADRKTQRTMSERLPDYVGNLSSSIWNTNDALNSSIDTLINKKLAGNGINKADMQQLFSSMKSIGSQKNSIFNNIEQAQYNAQRVIRTESARAIDAATMEHYRNHYSNVHSRFINIITEPGACSKCLAYASDGPYSIDDAPDLPIHPNCRCHKEVTSRLTAEI